MKRAGAPGPLTRLGVLGLAVLLASCTERALVEVDSDTAPGQATPTREIEIPVQGMISWRDTTYSGYEVPATSSYRVLADRSDLQGRLLARFETIPDSIDGGAFTCLSEGLAASVEGAGSGI